MAGARANKEGSERREERGKRTLGLGMTPRSGKMGRKRRLKVSAGEGER